MKSLLSNAPATFREPLSQCIEGHSLTLSSKPALIVVDMQRFFLDKEAPFYLEDSEGIAKPVKNLIDLFQNRSLPVVFTRHIDAKEGPMIDWWNQPITEEDPFSQISFDTSKSRVFPKTFYDGFWKTGLDEYLKEVGVDQVVVTGVLTHLCVESTARSAFMRGYSVVIPIDCVASADATFHFGSLLSLAHGFALLTESEEISQVLSFD
jgi:nicotinamidase-related amidase